MSKQTLDTGPNPEITVEDVQGDLQVRAWETAQVVVQADPDEVTLAQPAGETNREIQLTSLGDLDLRLPLESTLQINTVHGDASLKFMQGGLTIREIHGDLDVRHVAGCSIELAHGDLTTKNVAEDLQVELVHGDADARTVSGDCHFDQVYGNLDLQDVAGNIRAACKGTARLRLHAITGSTYEVEADGNLYCYLPEDASLRVRMHSDGHAIKVRLPQGSSTYQQPDYELTLGDGEAEMQLSSKGSLYLFVERPGWSESAQAGASAFGLPEDFGQQIAQQVESQIHSQMAEVTRRINEQMENLSQRLGRAGFSPEETERIIEQARRTSERESDRSQEKMRRAQEKLERKLESHRRRAESRSQAATDRRTRRQSWGFEWPAPPPPPPAPPKPQATEEERLMILRMLEQKKISLEEADQLLSALEGNG